MSTYYKVVSSSAAAAEFVGEKHIQDKGRISLHIFRRIFSNLYTLTSSIKPMQNLVHLCHKEIIKKIASNYKKDRNDYKYIEKYLTVQQVALETQCREKGINIDSWVFSIENRRIIREIMVFIEENMRFIIEMPITEQYFCLVNYIKEQEKLRTKIWDLDVEYPEDLIRKIPEMTEYAKYCVGIYGHYMGRVSIKKHLKSILTGLSNKEVFMKYTNTSTNSLVYSKGNSFMHLPGHAVIVSEEKKAIIVVIRGTKSFFDCIADLNSEYTNYTTRGITGKLHSGIYKSSVNLSNTLKPIIIKNLLLYPDYEIIILGHSLGAGCASLLSLIWLDDEDINKFPIKCYAYAPPSVISENLNKLLKGIVISCSNKDDIVPRLSLGSILDLCNIIEFLYKQDLSISCECLYEKSQEMCKEEKIYPPGDVFQIFDETDISIDDDNFDDKRGKKKCKEFNAGFVRNDFYGNILFSKNMLFDHEAPSYEEALKKFVRKYFG
ncbi:hypothetical protein SteCoe_5201 [Stentor coeruleus]|uniref:sn-1-specific diacylglycerol lipase n=1 Tax=Stentor coeruleus TaxID=5963 RepID=A0A1R2CT10_9CILI|nr:hypothetical protein SteCoe_5201 [Stentor coeruleus]